MIKGREALTAEGIRVCIVRKDKEKKKNCIYPFNVLGLGEEYWPYASIDNFCVYTNGWHPESPSYLLSELIGW
jgi:hypothetical protein